MVLWYMGALVEGREPRNLEECLGGMTLDGFPASLRSMEWTGADFWLGASLFALSKGYERESRILKKVPLIKGVRDLMNLKNI